MNEHTPPPTAHTAQDPPPDVVEDVVKHAHVVVPLVGAALMFLLAFIAVSMA